MTDKKPHISEMGIECVEFDEQDMPALSTLTPLGHFLHEGPATEEEVRMTSKLVAFSCR